MPKPNMAPVAWRAFFELRACMGFTNLYKRGGGAQLVLGFAQNGSQQIDTNKFPVDSPAWKINNHGFSKYKVDMYKFMWKCYKILLAT